MTAFIIRRLALLPLILFGVSLVIFGMMQMMSPFSRLAVYVHNPDQLKEGREQLQEMVEALGLDAPLWVQYGRWILNLFRGDLGWSETARRPVSEALRAYLPASAELALFAAIPVIFLGIRLGRLASIHHNRALDHAVRLFALLGWSLPTFTFAILAMMLFYGKLGWLPPGRLGVEASRLVSSSEFNVYTGMHTIDALLNGNLLVLGDALRHLILPVVTLAYLSCALLMRLMRSSMLEALRQDYVVTARSKGLSERVVVAKHAQRNALLPVVTVAGLMVAGLVNGVVVTEMVFNFHGLGQFAAEAAVSLDTASIIAFALFNGVLLVVANLVVDLLYAFLDPRVRLS